MGVFRMWTLLSSPLGQWALGEMRHWPSCLSRRGLLALTTPTIDMHQPWVIDLKTWVMWVCAFATNKLHNFRDSPNHFLPSLANRHHHAWPLYSHNYCGEDFSDSRNREHTGLHWILFWSLTLMLGKTEGRRRRKRQRMRWLETSLTQWTWVEQTLGIGEGQGSLACYSSRGHKESETTEWLNNNNSPWKCWNIRETVFLWIKK